MASTYNILAQKFCFYHQHLSQKGVKGYKAIISNQLSIKSVHNKTGTQTVFLTSTDESVYHSTHPHDSLVLATLVSRIVFSATIIRFLMSRILLAIGGTKTQSMTLPHKKSDRVTWGDLGAKAPVQIIFRLMCHPSSWQITVLSQDEFHCGKGATTPSETKQIENIALLATKQWTHLTKQTLELFLFYSVLVSITNL